MTYPNESPYWHEMRRLFPIFERKRYFASCSQGALCPRVEEAMGRFMASWREEGVPWATHWFARIGGAQAAFARLINAPAEAIGLTATVSSGVSAILSAIDFSQRRKVVVSELEFPTVLDILLAYRQKGLIDLVVLPAVEGDLPLERYAEAIDEGTALVCVSTVSYSSGARLPVAGVVELGHRAGALVLVDAFQGAGVVPIDVAQLGCDFLVTGAHKYLLGTYGLCFVYARPAIANGLEPTAIGWMSQEQPFAVDLDRLHYAPGGARFQGGTFTVPACYAGEAAINLLLEIGPDRIHQRVMALTRQMADGLAELGLRPVGPVDDGRRGPFVAVPTDRPEALEAALAAEGLVTAPRGQAIRFAFHFYNDESDVAAALEAIRRHR